MLTRISSAKPMVSSNITRSLVVYLKWKNFMKCESGATAIEYALIGALVSVAIVGGAGSLGNSVNSSFQNASNGFGG